MTETTTTITSFLTTFEGITPTTTTVTLTEQEMFNELSEHLVSVDQSFHLILALLIGFVIFLVCRYCYRFLNLFF